MLERERKGGRVEDVDDSTGDTIDEAERRKSG